MFPLVVPSRQLLCYSFPFKGNELMYVWGLPWWEMVNHLVTWLKPLSDLITVVEGDSITVGEAMHKAIPILNDLIPALQKFWGI